MGLDDLQPWWAVRFADRQHLTCYTDAVAAYTETSGKDPGDRWHPLLYLGTAMPGLWERLQPHVDFAKDLADLEAVELAPAEALLLQVADCFFQGSGQLNPVALAQGLPYDLRRLVWQVLACHGDGPVDWSRFQLEARLNRRRLERLGELYEE